MELPEALEALRNRKIWLCYPLIWNEKKHHGIGGYDKPPVNPHTLYPGKTDDPESLATFDEAAAQIGKTAHVLVRGRAGLVECKIEGVGVSLTNTGLLGLDLDNVIDMKRKLMTLESQEIVKFMDSYTELSPSETGLHILFSGKLPAVVNTMLAKSKPDVFENADKAEYQIFNSGYMTVSGHSVGRPRQLAERSKQLEELYKQYFIDVEPIEKLSTQRPPAPSVVSSATGYTRERWLEDVRRLSDAEILDRIFESGSTGRKVETLYNGDMSAYGDDHSRADQALMTYLYGFTSDRAMTERLFRASGLYRAVGKSRGYLNRTLNKAERDCKPLVGHIVFTPEEKRAYAQRKEAEERTKYPRPWRVRTSNSRRGGAKA